MPRASIKSCAEKRIQRSENLLKELGLNFQTALEATLVISIATTFDYPDSNSCSTIVMKARALQLTGGVLFSLPNINPPPRLDVWTLAKRPYGMIDCDELIIMGVEYLGKGRWELIGDFSKNDSALEDHFTTRYRRLRVKILKG